MFFYQALQREKQERMNFYSCFVYQFRWVPQVPQNTASQGRAEPQTGQYLIEARRAASSPPWGDCCQGPFWAVVEMLAGMELGADWLCCSSREMAGSWIREGSCCRSFCSAASLFCCMEG